MSYRKPQNKNQVTPKTKIHNPQTIYSHMQRMQNLLEEYDRENQFLNRQVRELLYLKEVSPIRQDLMYRATGVEEGRKWDRLVGPTEGALWGSREGRIGGIGRTGQREDSGRKRYEYVNQLSPVRVLSRQKKYLNTVSSLTSNSKQYKYTQQQDSNPRKAPPTSSKQNRIQYPNPKPFKLTLQPQPQPQTHPTSEPLPQPSPKPKPSSLSQPQPKFIRNQLSKVINYHREGKESPQRKSRLITQMELEKISQSQELRGTGDSRLNASVNFVPLIKREVYFRHSSPDNSQGRGSVNIDILSPERKSPSVDKSRPYINASGISLTSQKSNRSNKSGIEVTISEKSLSKQKQKQKYIKEGTDKGYIKPVQAKVVQTIIRTQSLPQPQIQSQNQSRLEQKQSIKNIPLPTLKLQKVEQDRNLQTFRSSLKQQNKISQNQSAIKPELPPQPQPNPNTQIPLQPIPPILKPQQTPTFQTLKSQPEAPTRPPQQLPLLSLHDQEPGQHLSQIYPFSLITQPKAEQNSVRQVMEVGVNTNDVQPHGQSQVQVQEENLLFRNRSFSQHRIQPSEKISYQDSREYKRVNSRQELRGKSIEGKKKFINVVSSEILAAKMGQKINSGNFRR